MRYFWTFFWSFLLVQMLTYVVSSMTPGAKFEFIPGAIVSVGVTILIFIASAIIPNEPVEQH
ncbi:YjzD family protein [Neobacillus sp. WH10]|uniref:YjzD family protein n=1 Tax=Neobacillus sp. WH10 TaxID=3047873 RepID=UPI0024C1B798|nr:YjzD family protein [Neobacillus sp. WH10]WHY78966.1 YjzD family protein [Neobacillus sp. WH10]